MNKKLLLATVAAASISSSAFASNHMTNDNAYTGFNFGVQGGASYNDYDFKSTDGASTKKASKSDTSGTVGAFVGYGLQTDSNLYMGLEVEGGFQFGDTKKTFTDGTTTFTAKVDPKHNVGVNAQLGYVMDPGLLMYLFGGVNFQSYETRFTDVTNTVTAKKDKFHTGYKIGAGMRYKFYDQVFGDLKYDFNSFNSKTVTLSNGKKLKTDADQHNVRIGFGMVV